LIDDPGIDRALRRIKRENVVLSDGDIDRYVALKAAFVAEVLTEARRARTMEPVTY